MFAASLAGLKFADEPESRSEDVVRRRLAQCTRRTDIPSRGSLGNARRRNHASSHRWNSEPSSNLIAAAMTLPGTIGTAVNVADDVSVRTFGMLFTANPHDPSRAEMLLEASWGPAKPSSLAP